MASMGNGNESAGEDSKPEVNLNEREKELYITAMMYCIKSGPVKIDYEKFRELGNFNTLKTAQNTWSKIKQKIPAVEAEDGGNDDVGSAKKPAKPAKATPKKRAAAAKTAVEDGEEDVEESPAKKPKKTPAKKSVAAGPDVVPSIEKEESGAEEN